MGRGQETGIGNHEQAVSSKGFFCIRVGLVERWVFPPLASAKLTVACEIAAEHSVRSPMKIAASEAGNQPVPSRG